MAWRKAWLLLAALGLPGCDSLIGMAATDAEVAESLVTVGRGDLDVTLLLTGELEAENAVELVTPRTENWQIAIKWMADDGAAVKKGDRVVEFDNSSVVETLADLEVAVVEAGVDLETQQAETAVQSAEKAFEVQTQMTAVAKAKLDATVPEQLISRREARDSALALQRAEVALISAKRDLEALRGGGRLDEQVKRVGYEKALRAYKAAGEQLDALVLTAPRDGIVLIGKQPWEGRKLQVGDNVWPGLTVAELPDLSKTLVQASLSDVDDRRVTPGMKVTCTVDAFPDVALSGFVRAVSPVAQSPSQESTRQFFRVVVELEDELPEQMRPGLSVKVAVPTRVLEDAVLVPRGALDWSTDPPTVTLEGGTRVEVTLDACTPQRCAVGSGLSEGQRVRLAGGAA